MNLILKGSTDVTRYVKLVDSAAGTPETGYTITNLDLQYTRNRTAPAAKVDAVALAATDTAHTDNRAIEVDGVSSPGLYRIDWPDAAFATGADKVILCVSGTGLDPCFEEIQLTNFNPEDGVRMGLTALPNAAADAAGGLPISDAGGLDLDAQLVTKINDILADTAEIGAAGAGLTVLATAAELAKVPKSDGTATWNATALASIQTEANDAIVANRLDELLAADSDIDGAQPPTVGSVFHELMTKTTGSFTYDQTTDSLEAQSDTFAGIFQFVTFPANFGSMDIDGFGNVFAHVVSMDTDVMTADAAAADFIAEVQSGLSTLTAAGVRTAVGLGSANLDTQLGDLPTNAELATALAAADDAVLSAIAALNNLSSAQAATAVLTTQMTEAYAADGVAPTLAQAVFLMQQHLTEFAISGTTWTTKRLDGSTTAATFTLDSATTPTAITRAT